MANVLKENFRPEEHLVVHWDGKMLPDITGKDTVDHLPILVPGNGISQLVARGAQVTSRDG